MLAVANVIVAFYSCDEVINLRPDIGKCGGQDLDPSPDGASPTKEWAMRRGKKASNATVLAEADFCNLRFLSMFVSETGKVPPRRRTRLSQKVHRHLARQIKVC